jgi:hypothetical protein
MMCIRSVFSLYRDVLPDRQAQNGLLCLERESEASRIVADVLLFDQLELRPLLGVESIYRKGMKKEADEERGFALLSMWSESALNCDYVLFLTS